MKLLYRTIVLLIISTSALANFKNDFELSDLNFYRYAQPQLRNLTSEFFLVLKKLNSHHEDFIEIQESLTTHIFKLGKCDDLKFCSAIDRIVSDLDKFEQRMWKLQKQLVKRGRSHQDELVVDYDQKIEASALAQKIQLSIYTIKTNLDLFIAENKAENSMNFKHKLLQDLKHLQILAQMGTTSLIDKSYKKDFEFINENFIRTIQKYVLLNNDKEFLLSRFRELDKSWNSFHVKLDKEIQNFPKSQLNLVKIMHNRWNSVLKIILRR